MWVGGVDEVGVGALAGPIVCVSVILPVEMSITRISEVPQLKEWWPLEKVMDSKETTEKQRETLQPELMEFIDSSGGFVGVSFGYAAAINKHGHREILSKTASQCVLEACTDKGSRPDFLIIDGKKGIDGYPGLQRIEPKADKYYFPVALASMLAKLIRDGYMLEVDKQYPVYGWARSKGYPTQEHRDALLQFGLTPEHRVKACETVLKKNLVSKRKPRGF